MRVMLATDVFACRVKLLLVREAQGITGQAQRRHQHGSKHQAAVACRGGSLPPQPVTGSAAPPGQPGRAAPRAPAPAAPAAPPAVGPCAPPPRASTAAGGGGGGGRRGQGRRTGQRGHVLRKPTGRHSCGVAPSSSSTALPCFLPRLTASGFARICWGKACGKGETERAEAVSWAPTVPGVAQCRPPCTAACTGCAPAGRRAPPGCACSGAAGSASRG